jgi:MFS transporter, DHA1 family, tetracycline resistance protein
MEDKTPGSLLSSYVIFFIDNFGYALAFPLFPILLLDPSHHFLAERITEGWRTLSVTGVLAAFPLAQFFGAPLFGELSDQLGRRRILTLTVSGTLIGYLLTAFSLIIASYPLLLFSRILTGFFAGNMAISLAILSDVSDSKIARAKHFSIAAALIAISWTSAFLFGSYLMEGYSFFTLPPQSTFWIISFLNLVALGVVRFFYQETTPSQPDTPAFSIKKAASHLFHTHKEGSLFIHYAVLFFWFVAIITSLLWVPRIFIERFLATADEISYLFILLGTFWFSASLLINRVLIGKLTLWQLSLWALFANGLFLFYTAAGDYFYYGIFSYSVCALCGGILWGNLFSFISLEGKDNQQGRVMGCAQACLSLAEAIGPILGGIIAGVSHQLILYLCSGSVMIAFLFLLANLYRRKNKRLLEYP